HEPASRRSAPAAPPIPAGHPQPAARAGRASPSRQLHPNAGPGPGRRFRWSTTPTRRRPRKLPRRSGSSIRRHDVTIPNLAGVATSDLVEKIGGGNFSASYINWARTLHLLRENAPGWLPELMLAPDGSILHRSPVGGFLLIRFVNIESGAA